MAEIRTLKDQDTQILPRTRAEAVTMSDGKTLQEKYDAGELGGGSGDAQQIVDAHNVSTSAHKNMGWITTKDGEPSEPAKINADSLGGIPAEQYVSKDETGNIEVQKITIKDEELLADMNISVTNNGTIEINTENSYNNGRIAVTCGAIDSLTQKYRLLVGSLNFSITSRGFKFYDENGTLQNIEVSQTGVLINDNPVLAPLNGVLPVQNGGTGLTKLDGTDYSASRLRGIALRPNALTSIDNGLIVGVYE